MKKEKTKKEDQIKDQDGFSIPDEKYAPKPGKTPTYQKDLENFADIEDTAKKTLVWFKNYKDTYEGQNQRKSFEDEMDIADEMFRAATNRTMLNSDQSDNVVDTSSKVKSGTYYADLRAITASEKAVIIGNEEQLPVIYEPIPGSQDYREDEARTICEYRNAYLSYVFETAGIRGKIGKALWAVNKYGNVPVEMCWDRVEQERKIRVPSTWVETEDRRIPKSFKWQKKKFRVKDFPDLKIHDNKDVWLDAMIDDVQAQPCIIIRTQRTLDDLWGLQKAGEIKNVEKIKMEHRYQGEGGANTVKQDRQTNAGETADANKPTNLFDVYYGWIKAPINPESGKWEPDKFIPQWHEFAFVGGMDSDQVCIKIKELPYSNGLVPFMMFHSHEDDKGAYHMGFSNLIKSNIAQEMTTLDQAFDNVKLRNRKPWIAERGSVSLRDFTFATGGNQVYWKTPGAQDPHECEVQDTTQICMPMLAELRERRRELMGTNKPLLGEPLGGRTSASEALGIYDQALKPAFEDAKYKANQILVFVAYWAKEMWEEFCDPERSLFVTYQNQMVEIKPENIWGDINIRVTAIIQFQDSILRKKEEDQFINQILPILLQNRVIDQKGLRVLAGQILMNRSFHNIDAILATTGDYEARRIARMENQAILNEGVYDMPKPEENHEVHIEEHKPALATYMLLAPEYQNDNNTRTMKTHILQHEQNVKTTMPQQQVPGAEARTPGEAAGDMMGAQAGAEENLGAVEMGGRPPMIGGQA